MHKSKSNAKPSENKSKPANKKENKMPKTNLQITTRPHAIAAIAAACNLPVDKVKAKFTAIESKPPAKNVDIIEATVKALGHRTTVCDAKKFVKDYPKPHNGLKHVTTHHPIRFEKIWKNGKAYLLYTHRDIVAVNDGKVQTWAAKRSLPAERILLVS